MSTATGFLLRTSLSDTGSLPRSGNWTGCPDIVVAGTTAMSSNEIVSAASYATVIDKPITQALTNFFYIRAKNMNSTPLSQVAYLFQVPGSLVLRPEQWFKATYLVGYDQKNPVGDGSPDDPKIIQKYAQPITANAGQIAVTNAYSWAPQTTEHHCMVAVVASSWNEVLQNYPPGGSMEALAQWIYGNASLGWHNVDILPITTKIYENKVAYAHSAVDEPITFTIIANNVPVGARVSFSANNSTQGGNVIGQNWTVVSSPPGGGSINPDFEVGLTLTINAGYATIITYRTDFNGLTPPDNFAMSMKVTKAITPTASNARLSDSLAHSFSRAYAQSAVFHNAEGEHVGHGLNGYLAMLSAYNPDPDSGGDLEEQVVVVVGSHTTTPVGS